MKRRLLSLIYLVSSKDKPLVDTTTASTIVNKIPCQHEHFFKISSAEFHVLKELSEYPATMEQKEMQHQERSVKAE